MDLLRQKLTPAAAFCTAVLQTGGFLLWYHDHIGVENLVITGPSMLPTFNHPRLSGDVIVTEAITSWLPNWVENLHYLPASLKTTILNHLPNFKKGDVVLAYSPIELDKRICKRLIAEAGEIVHVPMDGSIHQGKTIIIPEGHVWLEGDCPRVSRDCRHYGPIPRALLHGRPWFQVLHLGKEQRFDIIVYDSSGHPVGLDV